jgi:hypothetical protein
MSVCHPSATIPQGQEADGAAEKAPFMQHFVSKYE